MCLSLEGSDSQHLQARMNKLKPWHILPAVKYKTPKVLSVFGIEYIIYLQSEHMGVCHF